MVTWSREADAMIPSNDVELDKSGDTWTRPVHDDSISLCNVQTR
jgi:hypothetical protein